MDNIEHLVKLMDLELSLLVSKAKFKPCIEKFDLDDALAAQEIAFDCGMQYELLGVTYTHDPELMCHLKNAINELYFSLPLFLRDGFNSGRCDVTLGRMD